MAGERVMTFRKIVFWIHLTAGIAAGAVIAIMSVTGVAIAFEEEILAWYDREVSRMPRPPAGKPRLTFEELRALAQRERPDFRTTMVVVPRKPDRAYALFAGREGPLYANPFTGELRASRAHGAHEVIHLLEEWHRWLGMRDGALPVGRLITGVCNIAFLILCLTGLYLWFPRRWRWTALRPQLWFVGPARGKARDFNWHNVFGFWSLPVLVVLAATAVVISFAWGHRLVFNLAGEEAPQARNFGMMATPPAVVPPAAIGAARVPLERVVAEVAAQFPSWRSIGLNLPVASEERLAPLDLEVTLDDPMPSRAYVPVEVDPFTGKILQAVRFQDRSLGLRSRVWMRFLHTGGAFGVPGKIVATLATMASLVLVYTGFALSWRRLSRSMPRAGEA